MRNEAMDDTRNGERGTALVMVLLILALLLTLVMASSLTAISESGVANTYGTQTIALQAAESGLNHAASLVWNYTGADFTELLSDRYVIDDKSYFPIDSARFTPGAQMIVATSASGEPLLASGAFAPATNASGFMLRDANNNVVPGASYSVELRDDEPCGNGVFPCIPNFNPTSGYDEIISPDAKNPNIDKNKRLVIYSTGKYANASVTLEGWIAFLPYPALSAEGDITVSGNTLVNGQYGGVHSNANLLLAQGGGNNWYVEQTFTATKQIVGDPTGHVGGFYGGGQEPLYIPPFVTTEPLTSGGAKTNPRLQEFLIRKADRILFDPKYADNAHESDPSENSDNDGGKATVRLSTLAGRLNIPYQMLVAALDSDGSTTRVQQSSETAIEVTRDNAGNATSVVKLTIAQTGWAYTGGTNAYWGIDTNANGLQAGGKSYYVVGRDNFSSNLPNGGNVKLTGNVGSGTQALNVTILATGSIEISGTPNITANMKSLQTTLLPPFVKPDILMVAVQDIKVTGDNNSSIQFTGVSFAGEQVELSSSGDINGQVISLSNKHVPGTPVSANSISGKFVLTLNDGNSVGRIKLYTWRQIKN